MRPDFARAPLETTCFWMAVGNQLPGRLFFAGRLRHLMIYSGSPYYKGWRPSKEHVDCLELDMVDLIEARVVEPVGKGRRRATQVDTSRDVGLPESGKVRHFRTASGHLDPLPGDAMVVMRVPEWSIARYRRELESIIGGDQETSPLDHDYDMGECYYDYQPDCTHQDIISYFRTLMAHQEY